MASGLLRDWRAALARRRSDDAILFRVQAVGLLLVLAALVYLAVGQKPWSGGIAERLREGKSLRGIDFARTWGWWTTAGNAALLLGLVATARRWLVRGPAPQCHFLVSPRMGSLSRVLVAAAVATSALLAWPRLFHSYWDDEEYTVRRHIDGFWVPDDGGALRFQEVHWRDTFWEDHEANNHIPFTTLARLSLAGWRAATEGDESFAYEPAVRFPAYVAGIAAVAASALFVHRLGFGLAAPVAAWILALHPWLLRYASEARGYAFTLLLVPTTWMLLLSVLQSGSWGRWIAYGLAQFVLLWVNPGMVYQLAVTNLVAAIAIWHLHRWTSAGRDQLTRFALANLGSAMLFAQLMLPNMLQVLNYLAEWRGRGTRVPHLAETLAHLFAGAVWHEGDPHIVTVQRLAAAAPRAVAASAGAGVLLLLAGAGRLTAAGGVRALLLPVLALPAPLFYLSILLQHDRYYPWYVVFALPALASLMAIGLAAPFERIARRPLAGSLVAAAAVAFLGLYGWVTQPVRASLRAVSVLPVRESVLLTRPELDPFAPANQRVLTCSIYRPALYYDPLGRFVASQEELVALMQEADARGLPLFVNYGRPRAARQQAGELVELVEREDLFERVATLHGSDERGTREVRRYRGGTSARLAAH